MRRLVVLTSGWGKVDLAWFRLRDQFLAQGFDVIYANYPHRGMQPIEIAATATSEVINVVAPDYDHITLVGHSMGGLIGRYIIQYLQNSNIDAFISIGTPHFGSLLAYLAPFSPSAQQMCPGSPFLEALNALEWPNHVPILTLSGAWDYIVLPQKNTRLPFAEDITIPVATHSGLVIHPRTFLEMWSWLAFEILGEDSAPLLDSGRSTYFSNVRFPWLGRSVGLASTAVAQARKQLRALPSVILRRPNVEPEAQAA